MEASTVHVQANFVYQSNPCQTDGYGGVRRYPINRAVAVCLRYEMDPDRASEKWFGKNDKTKRQILRKLMFFETGKRNI